MVFWNKSVVGDFFIGIFFTSVLARNSGGFVFSCSLLLAEVSTVGHSVTGRGSKVFSTMSNKFAPANDLKHKKHVLKYVQYVIGWSQVGR